MIAKLVRYVLQVIRAGLQRYISDNGLAVDISNNPSLKKANQAFKAAKRRYATQGGNRRAGQGKEPIDPRDQAKIAEYFQQPDTYTDPTKLQQLVYYMFSMHFGYRGCEIWHQLLHTGFVEGVDELGRPRYTIDQALIEKNFQQTGPNSTCRRTVKIVDDPENEVYLFSTVKHYIDKLDKRQPKFLAKPKTERQVAKDRDAPLYVKSPLGVHTIGQIMPGISAAAGTSKRYTNHCVRHTLGTNMLRMGFPLSAIQARLRLRSERTLAWYTAYRTADELSAETRTISEPLRGMPRPHQPAQSSVAAEAGPSSAGAGDGRDAGGSGVGRVPGQQQQQLVPAGVGDGRDAGGQWQQKPDRRQPVPVMAVTLAVAESEGSPGSSSSSSCQPVSVMAVTLAVAESEGSPGSSSSSSCQPVSVMAVTLAVAESEGSPGSSSSSSCQPVSVMAVTLAVAESEGSPGSSSSSSCQPVSVMAVTLAVAESEGSPGSSSSSSCQPVPVMAVTLAVAESEGSPGSSSSSSCQPVSVMAVTLAVAESEGSPGSSSSCRCRSWTQVHTPGHSWLEATGHHRGRCGNHK